MIVKLSMKTITIQTHLSNTSHRHTCTPHTHVYSGTHTQYMVGKVQVLVNGYSMAMCTNLTWIYVDIRALEDGRTSQHTGVATHGGCNKQGSQNTEVATHGVVTHGGCNTRGSQHTGVTTHGGHNTRGRNTWGSQHMGVATHGGHNTWGSQHTGVATHGGPNTRGSQQPQTLVRHSEQLLLSVI